ncbi:hypothetical protein ACFJGV_11505 [Cnuibacter sp. UC19_7]|uniref:hypothetical protein n=1 Tax=Cnuibacter sp. UC19_7 TaxID=3350166 RepID=UPI00367247C9
MAVLVVSSLLIRAHTVSRDGVEGWLPLVEADVRGAVTTMELSIAGHSYELPMSAHDQGVSTRALLPDGPVVTAGGEMSFEIRADGMQLFSGTVIVEKDEGSWNARPAELPGDFIAIQASGDPEAPWFRTGTWMPGAFELDDIDVVLELDGETQDVDIEGSYVTTFGSGDESVTFHVTDSEFIRAWDVREDSDDGSFDLFANRGEYSMAFSTASESKTLAFRVDDGVLVTEGPAELDLNGDLLIFADGSPVWGGYVHHDIDVAAWYSRFVDLSEPDDGDATTEDAEPPSAEAEAAIASVQTHVGTYRDDLVSGGGSLDHDQVDYALSDFLPLRERMAGLRASDPDDRALADAAAQLDELIALAERFLRGEADEAEALLAPYRAVLRADKLSICLDRPPHEYRYLTTGKREITTPEALAAAPVWYFEGAARRAAPSSRSRRGPSSASTSLPTTPSSTARRLPASAPPPPPRPSLELLPRRHSGACRGAPRGSRRVAPDLHRVRVPAAFRVQRSDGTRRNSRGSRNRVAARAIPPAGDVGLAAVRTSVSRGLRPVCARRTPLRPRACGERAEPASAVHHAV